MSGQTLEISVRKKNVLFTLGSCATNKNGGRLNLCNREPEIYAFYQNAYTFIFFDFAYNFERLQFGTLTYAFLVANVQT